jgi:hypothetical protein
MYLTNLALTNIEYEDNLWRKLIIDYDEECSSYVTQSPSLFNVEKIINNKMLFPVNIPPFPSSYNSFLPVGCSPSMSEFLSNYQEYCYFPTYFNHKDLLYDEGITGLNQYFFLFEYLDDWNLLNQYCIESQLRIFYDREYIIKNNSNFLSNSINPKSVNENNIYYNYNNTLPFYSFSSSSYFDMDNYFRSIGTNTNNIMYTYNSQLLCHRFDKEKEKRSLLYLHLPLVNSKVNRIKAGFIIGIIARKVSHKEFNKNLIKCFWNAKKVICSYFFIINYYFNSYFQDIGDFYNKLN